MKKQQQIETDLLSQLKADFTKEVPFLHRLHQCLHEQVGAIVESKNISLGVPMEGRIKDLTSAEEKFKRKSFTDINDFEDLVGLRVILLFQQDIAKIHEALQSHFSVISFEDTGSRLDEDQFGYQSSHYIIQLPDAWGSIPSYSDLVGKKAEIQVRTLAQHIWAASSHKLQYKREESVPRPLRRSINRISALLETVDLEFDRLIRERESYLSEEKGDNQILNVDVLAQILRENWPNENEDDSEDFDRLLQELFFIGVKNADELKQMITENYDDVMEQEGERVQSNDTDYPGFNKSRFEKGVFFTLVGLTRCAVEKRVGVKRFREVLSANF